MQMRDNAPMRTDPRRFTNSIDWREPVTLALAMLRDAHPDLDVLQQPDLDRVANQYVNLPILEGAAALGQELSRFAVALYQLDTGTDESVFLLVTGAQERPPDTLQDLAWRPAHDATAAEEPLSAKLLCQTGRAWGAKARRIRAPSLSLQRADAARAQWDLGPGTRFEWLNERLGLLSSHAGAMDCTDEVRTQSHVVDVARWNAQPDGIAHMFVASFDEPALTAVPFDDFDGAGAALLRRDRSVMLLSTSAPCDAGATLPLPAQFPPALPLLQSAGPADVPLVPSQSVPAEYRVSRVFRTAADVLWLACSPSIHPRRLREFHRDIRAAESAATTLESPATVFIQHDASGRPLGWQLESPGHACWGRQAAWITAPPTSPGGSARRFLLRDVIDDSAEQRVFASLLQIEAAGPALTLRPITTSRFTLNGSAVWLPQLPGLPSCDAGYVLYGAQAPMHKGHGGEFSCVAVNPGDGRIWTRSLRAMQPRFGSCHYAQRIRVARLPDDWLLLDIDGDGFGLQDTAWLWNLATDQQYAIPLAAVSESRENAALHFQREADCLFALGAPMEGDAWLQMLQPFAQTLAAVTSTSGTRREAAPWIEAD